VSSEVEDALKKSGIPEPTIPAEISIRFRATGKTSPPIQLHQDERVAYAQAMQSAIDELITPMIKDAAFMAEPIDVRNRILERQMRAAREIAEAEVYASMDPDDASKRMDKGAERRVPVSRP
jgi:hypothetical protein